MKDLRNAAAIAMAFIIIKLVFRLIPPSERFFSLFENGVWVGLGIILTAYLILFVIIYLILVVKRRRKEKG
ncbi:hypothetical protein QPK24_10360 [Paenibacillus polygoni]|uniref:Uncharacterized protein n=1 Tax=Paenibacillus polygoni TaxID=3050112 RepID=A0ABY8X677_9BACL|nr:hypothetical protein [Paenibacillus polygoni]WIV21036.1 hypothetical protein QPK24_10360 [Paenibacillus polygoni]